ncbi:hypothetical protein ACHHV8_33120 [Paenibacillus sp. TAB 01]|uniref:hypothetical protein n=1 Tax=Paenibacillus sp. TAB 01 TaxID=3368988 RepID=UPI003753A6D0
MWKKPRRKLSVAAGLWIGLLLTFIINSSVHRGDDRPVLARLAPAAASSGPADKQVVLLSVPGLSFTELGDDSEVQASTPVLQHLKKVSAWGAMNIRTPGRGAADVYLSLGAGQFAEGGSAARAVHKEEWKDGQLSLDKFNRFRGIDGADVRSDLIVPEWGLMLRANENIYHRAEPGLLGETLKSAGVRLSVWGNTGKGMGGGDSTREEAARADRRYAPLMLAAGPVRLPAAGWMKPDFWGTAATLPAYAPITTGCCSAFVSKAQVLP